MIEQQLFCAPEGQEALLKNEDFWKSLYETLRKPVTSLIYRYKVASWIGQEDDLVNDIIQETVMRLYNRLLASPGTMLSIRSVEAFAYTIARHYCLDLVRKEKRTAHLPDDVYELEMLTTLLNEEDELTSLLDTLSLQSLLTGAAHIIAAIPPNSAALSGALARPGRYRSGKNLIIASLVNRILLPASQGGRCRSGPGTARHVTVARWGAGGRKRAFWFGEGLGVA